MGLLDLSPTIWSTKKERAFPLVLCYLRAGGKIVFQSSFMLITVQPSFFASAMSASLTLNTVSSYWTLVP